METAWGPDLDRLLSRVEGLDSPQRVDAYRGRTSPLPLRCSIVPPVPWNRTELEKTLSLTLPPQLAGLWEKTSGLRLFEDIKYGQWGLHLWGPSDTVRMHPVELTYHPPEVMLRCDLFVGRFLGDADRLVLRCDRDLKDFGSVQVAVEIEPRREWPMVGHSLAEFLDRYVKGAGEKFWEPQSHS
jgi:hypothetical protein